MNADNILGLYPANDAMNHLADVVCATRDVNYSNFKSLSPKALIRDASQYSIIGKVIEMKQPTLKQLERWMDDGICKATDGCIVEPDGICEHGCESWLLKLGLI